MMQFYDLTESGAKPYNPEIIWAGPFSTGLYRYKSIYFTSSEQVYSCSIEGSIMQFYDPSTSDIKDLKNTITITGQELESGSYWFQLIIVCRADVEGEYITDLTIGDKTYQFGTEFWSENETLSINLANKGIEIPSLISKALYKTDIYDGEDWVVLNRKFREILQNYMDLLGNKGSYKNLFNSLKWFEYGDLVKMKEVWKYDTPDGIKYFEKEISSYLNDEYKKLLFNSAKTTYISFKSSKTELTNDGLVDTVYEKDFFDDKEVKGLSCIWSENEMRLKMILLGNFFETYFIPVHLNIFQSVVDDVIISELINMSWCGNDCVHDECFSEMGNFDLDWDGADSGSEDKSGLESDIKVHLDEVHVYAGLPQDDPNGQLFENMTIMTKTDDYKDLEYIPIVACHDMNDSNAPITTLNLFAGQFFNGIGCIATANFKFPESVISGQLDTNLHGDIVTIKNEIKSTDNFSIKFLFQRPGNFIMMFRFVGESKKVYTKLVRVEVEDNLVVGMEIKKLVASNLKGEPTIDPFHTFDIPNQYMFMRTKEPNYKYTDDVLSLNDAESCYIQYLPIADGEDGDAPYLTTMHVIQYEDGYDVSKILDELSNIAWYRHSEGGHYIQFISKYRGNNIAIDIPKDVTYYTKKIFFPELHKLVEPVDTVSRKYPLVCIPVIRIDGTKTVPYSKFVDASQPAWEFFSWKRQEVITELNNIKEPFIAQTINSRIPKGYYTIKFRYKWGDEVKKVIKNTNFRLV